MDVNYIDEVLIDDLLEDLQEQADACGLESLTESEQAFLEGSISFNQFLLEN